jgi:hypothetical protein
VADVSTTQTFTATVTADALRAALAKLEAK